MIDNLFFFLFPPQKNRYEMAKEYFVKVYKILADKQLLMEYPKKTTINKSLCLYSFLGFISSFTDE